MVSKKITIVVLVFLSLFACAKVEKIEEKNGSDDAETIFNNQNKTTEISPLASESWFRDDIYLITNPSNGVLSLVKGDGKVLLTTYEPDIENIGKIIDIDKDKTNYIYKTYTGEKYIKENIGSGDYEYVDVRPTQKCIVYDKNGNEIGLVMDSYSPKYSSINKIIYTEGSSDYDGLMAYDVNTKESTKIDSDEIYVMNGRFLLTTSAWDDVVENEEISICDENLNVIKKIEGYSLTGVSKVKDTEYASIRKKIKDSGEDKYKYNFIDSDFNIIFENDIDEVIWTGDQSYITLRNENKIIDYNFVDKKFVGEEKDYDKAIKGGNKELEEKYSDTEAKILNENTVNGKSKYWSIYHFDCNDKVIYVAHMQSDIGMFDNDKVDIYDENGKKVAEFDDLSNQFNKSGLLFVNHDTLYDINLNVVGKLKEKRNLELENKFDKVYFSDGIGLDYSSIKPFTLYNDKMEPVLTNLECIEMNTYDDYIVIVDSEGTKLLDKDFNIIKKLDRKLDIKSWYDNEKSYKTFEDLDTERMGIIDKDLNILVDKLKYVGTMENKYFEYQNGFEYGIMDYEGKPIIKFSIFDNMMEDSVKNDFRGDYVVKYDDY